MSEIEAGLRLPSVRTYAKLRAAVGLSAPAAALIPLPPPCAANEQLLRSTCAALLAVHRLPLADLASALEVSMPAAREFLARVADRLAQFGYMATEDGSDICMWPLTEVGEAVRRVAGVEVEEGISAEQLEVLCIVVTLGEATRAQVEQYRREDCETILGRLVGRGLLAKVRDEHEIGAPNVYQITAKALRAAIVID